MQTEKPRLLILGASARAAAQSAVRAGFRPYTIDLFADADLQALATTVQIERYPHDYLRALAAAPQAPWMYTGSLENYPRLITRLAKLRPLVGNDAEVLTKVRDPLWLTKLLADTAVRYPETIVGQESKVGSPGEWLVKPLRSGGGMGIRSAPTPDCKLLTPDSCFQQRIVGQSLSASFIATNDEVNLIGAAEQWIGAPWGAPQEFQYAGSLAPLLLSPREEAALLDIAQRLTAAANLRGMFGLDLIRSDDGLWLIEVNPRYTASMELLERWSGLQLITEHVTAFDNINSQTPVRREPRPPDSRTDQLHAKLIVYADRVGVGGSRLQDTLRKLAHDQMESADIPHLGTQFAAGNPICTLLVSGESREAIQNKLLSAAERVRESLDP